MLLRRSCSCDGAAGCCCDGAVAATELRSSSSVRAHSARRVLASERRDAQNERTTSIHFPACFFRCRPRIQVCHTFFFDPPPRILWKCAQGANNLQPRAGEHSFGAEPRARTAQFRFRDARSVQCIRGGAGSLVLPGKVFVSHICSPSSARPWLFHLLHALRQ